jgi:dolichol-phosphate mannosyltransferase
MRTLVVLPTYEEAGNIAEVLRRIRSAVPDADILVVDDSSPDGTAAIARAGGVDVLVRAAKSGLGSAYREGFAAGLRRGYEILVAMDSDLSHDPAALPGLLGAVERGADLAVGSRYVRGGSIPHWSVGRRALSRWGNRYAGRVLGLPLADATSGFRAYRADALARLELSSVRSDGYGFQVEIAYRMARAGGRIVEMPIRFARRERGASKMSARIVLEALALVTWWGVRDCVRRRRAVATSATRLASGVTPTAR